jgi:transcription-repair coupling factor (superfamily II helicase)
LLPSVSESTANKRTKLTGICPAARPHALTELFRLHPAPVWLVIHEEAQKSDALAEDIALFHAAGPASGQLDILTFPEAPAGEMREAFNAASDRLAVLSRLHGARDAALRTRTLLVLATPAALLQPVPPSEEFATRELTLTRGETRQPFQALLDAAPKTRLRLRSRLRSPGPLRGARRHHRRLSRHRQPALPPRFLRRRSRGNPRVRPGHPALRRDRRNHHPLRRRRASNVRFCRKPVSPTTSRPARTSSSSNPPRSRSCSAFRPRGSDGLTRSLKNAPPLFGVSDIDEASALFDVDAAERDLGHREPRAPPQLPEDSPRRAGAPARSRRTPAAQFLVQVAAWRGVRIRRHLRRLEGGRGAAHPQESSPKTPR